MKRAGQLQISVVVPVFNEAGNVAPLLHEIDRAVQSLGAEYEILFVNDGSQDTTLAELQAELARVPRLRIIDLEHNVGEAGALSAGFSAARGQWIVTLDGDGQNDPADIPRLWRVAQKGYSAVSGWRRKRQEGWFLRVLPSRAANALIRWVTGVPVHDNGCGLKVYRAEVAKRVQLPRGFNRFLPAILGVQASEVAEVEVTDRRRQHGQSHYGLSRTFVVMRDLLAIPFILRNPELFHRFWSTATMVALVAGVTAAMLGFAWFALACVPVMALSATIWWNLDRFLRAQRDGVFRIRREFSRLTSVEDAPAPGRAEASGAARPC